jgi:hypothetical protein
MSKKFPTITMSFHVVLVVNSKQRWASKKMIERHLHTGQQDHCDLFPVASALRVSGLPGLCNPIVDYCGKDGY